MGTCIDMATPYAHAARGTGKHNGGGRMRCFLTVPALVTAWAAWATALGHVVRIALVVAVALALSAATCGDGPVATLPRPGTCTQDASRRKWAEVQRHLQPFMRDLLCRRWGTKRRRSERTKDRQLTSFASAAAAAACPEAETRALRPSL